MKTTTLIFTVFSDRDNYLSANKQKEFIVERSGAFVESVESLTQCSKSDAIDITKVIAEELEFHLNNVKKSNNEILDVLWCEIKKLPNTEEVSQTLIDFLNVVDRINGRNNNEL